MNITYTNLLKACQNGTIKNTHEIDALIKLIQEKIQALSSGNTSTQCSLDNNQNDATQESIQKYQNLLNQITVLQNTPRSNQPLSSNLNGKTRTNYRSLGKHNPLLFNHNSNLNQSLLPEGNSNNENSRNKDCCCTIL